MTLWTWALAGLCGAAVLLALASLVPVALGVARLFSHAKSLEDSRLFLSLQSLQLQMNRFAPMALEAQTLAARAREALARLQGFEHESGLPEMRGALAQAGAEITGLFTDLD